MNNEKNLIRKQCYFTRKQDLLLKEWCLETGLKQAEIVRNAISKYLGEDIMENQEELEKRIKEKEKEKEIIELQLKEMKLQNEINNLSEKKTERRWFND